MSTTANDIIELALRRIKIVSRDEAMQADDAAHALKVMNMMMHGWDGRGANINHSDYTFASPVQIQKRLQDGLVHLLAVRLAPDFSVPTPSADGFDYRSWWESVLAAGLDLTPVAFDTGLSSLPSQRRVNASG